MQITCSKENSLWLPQSKANDGRRHLAVTLLVVVSLLLISGLPLKGGEVDKQQEGWTTSGELPYSYSYAKSYLGHKLRLKGWVCTLGFTCGPRQSIEHSIWERQGKKLQVMIWRIESNRTGYSWGEYTDGK